MNELEKQEELLEKMNKAKDKIQKRMTILKKDANVKRYLKLQNDLEDINDDYDNVKYQYTLNKCECCNHLIVVSGYHEDYCDNRFVSEYGCIKCGVCTHLKQFDDIKEFRPYIDYMQKNFICPQENTGLYFNCFNDFLDAQKFYLDNKNKYNDKEIIKLLKENNRQNKKRKDR